MCTRGLCYCGLSLHHENLMKILCFFWCYCQLSNDHILLHIQYITINHRTCTNSISVHLEQFIVICSLYSFQIDKKFIFFSFVGTFGDTLWHRPLMTWCMFLCAWSGMYHAEGSIYVCGASCDIPDSQLEAGEHSLSIVYGTEGNCILLYMSLSFVKSVSCQMTF